MKKIFVLIILLIAANVFLARTLHFKNFNNDTIDTSKTIHPLKYMENEDVLISTILQRYHYRKFKLNDSLSGVIYNRYLKTMDDNRSYFYASDIAGFDKFKYQLDDDIKSGNLNEPFQMFNVFRNRMNERINFAERILEKGFDFNGNDVLQFDREKASWAKDSIELNDIWYKKTKNDALNLMLAGKKWDDVKSTLKKRYENLRKSLLQYSNEDVFQLFENSFTESLDPHTNYMSPQTSDNFKIDMSRSVEGIGAQLQTEDEYTKIAEVVPGGPAFKSKLLHRDDKIVAVAQGKEGEFVDIVGWRVTDVVQLIRGPKGSVVRLQIIPANQGANVKPKEITLVRDKINLEEQSAKSKTLEIKNNGKNYKVGVITIPAFYSDFEAEQRGDKDYKSTTKDVQKLLNELIKEKVHGVVIDLRNNGGGSLEEAIKLTGLFIKSGPVVQIKSADGSIREEDDPDPSILYSGPLAILENRFSASASEIFAAAIQDYGRGLIIGEESYGKGTVQNLIDLNRLMQNSSDKLGQIKLTIAKFYRINGESTQHLGVMPDIKFPPAIDFSEVGESSEPSSLPWDQIKSANYTPFGNIKKYVPELIKKHDERIKSNDPLWEEYMDEVNDYKEAHDKKTISLNEAIRKKEHDEDEQKRFEKENVRRKNLGLKLLKKGETPPADEDLKNDPLLDETGHILADYIAIIG
ncbi:MAG: carboxy terminal-processing peptidase [Ignavibacteriaceae bacterium]|nr:carboxy terminal-processing peptidase [Ignavibacteriaceae bacterium]